MNGKGFPAPECAIVFTVSYNTVLGVSFGSTAHHSLCFVVATVIDQSLKKPAKSNNFK